MSRRFGHAALIGRPNVGKSTLLNRIVDAPLAIVTHKPQTTRHRIMGIHSEARGQIVFVDTPGLHRRRDHALNRRLNRIAADTSRGVDVLVLVIDATRQTDEDDLALAQVAQHEGQSILVINKIDLLKDRAELLKLTERWVAGADFKAVVYVSALRNDGVEDLLSEVFKALPEGEPAYPEDQFTDRSERFLAAEMVREQLMLQLHQEIPYGLSVIVERFERTGTRIEIDALIVVSEDRHKGMVIGRQGQVLKRVGSRARAAIGELLGERVHLNLHVRTRKGWIDDEGQLDELGYSR
ncbi:GTPase Era [Wenzhouxiangella marina]|uniref:GTPase Era n=1 Tax=Wenzhouxiangella marina TaxID=1579979 RepID=A0A0K0XXS6_9GAMM|nr:GTPase Era [Wenzhouxiangella marina]AKS42437.1 GTPase Era [Wenzhouxiangella marina]MBB6085788.1 GTP-binding protein Era [Wenzhouxiangella marina]